MKIWMPLILIAGLSRNMEAAPSISSNSGTIADGQSITLTGVNFGTSTQKPFAWADFESGNTNPNSSLGFISGWQDSDGFAGVTATTDNFSGSVYCASFTRTAGNEAGRFSVPYPSTFSQLYVYEKSYYSWTPQCAGNTKFWRLWPEINTSGSNDMVCGYGSGFCMSCDNEGDGNGTPERGQGTLWPIQQWFQSEFIWSYAADTGKLLDGVTDRTCDGVGGNPPAGTCFGGMYNIRNGNLNMELHDVYNVSDNHKLLDICENVVANTNPSDGSYNLCDDVFVSSSISRVVLSTTSTWAKAVIRKPQPHSAWANNGQSITITLKVADMSSGCSGGSACYAYVVTDATGTLNGVNANGFLLASSGGSATPLVLPVKR